MTCQTAALAAAAANGPELLPLANSFEVLAADASVLVVSDPGETTRGFTWKTGPRPITCAESLRVPARVNAERRPESKPPGESGAAGAAGAAGLKAPSVGASKSAEPKVN